MADQSKISSTIDKLKNQQVKNADNLKKSIDDKVNFIKEEANINPSDAKKAIVGLLLPLLNKFIKTEKTANAILNKIMNGIKSKLKDKGRVDIKNGAITFTPRNPGNYEQFKKDFDRKVNNLKNVIKILKTILDAILVVLRVLKTALIALQVKQAIAKKKLQIQAVAASGELASPSPAKPVDANYTINDRIDNDLGKKLDDKINNYILMIGVIQTILGVFQKMVNNIKTKLNILSLTITNTSQTPLNSLINDINDIELSTPSEIEYTDGNKEYIIKVETTLSGAIQAVAFDKFSMMRITQTAPSKVRKADELIEELKQILG